MHTVTTISEAGIDWITATANTKDAASRLAMVSEQAAGFLAADGYKRRRWAQWGFVGESVRYVSWGYRGEDVVCVMSGFAADLWFSHVSEVATHISRLDIQATVKTDPPLKGVAHEHYRQLIHAGPGGRKGASASLILASDESSTCYLGRRASDKWLRVYDKQRESNDEQYIGCWRYELECKNEAASTLARYLTASGDRPGAIAAILHKHCTSRGLRPVYSPNCEGVYLQSPRPPTDLERQCNWLCSTVGGTAREVAACVGTKALLTILGVGDSTLGIGRESAAHPHGNHAYESYEETMEAGV